MFAVCSDCKKLSNLQVCFDCKYTLCSDCIKKHFTEWKLEANTKCLHTENKLESYNVQFGEFNSKITKNLESLTNAEKDIQAKFEQVTACLLKEKNELLNSINEIKQQSKKFTAFTDENKTICTQLTQFRNAPEW